MAQLNSKAGEKKKKNQIPPSFAFCSFQALNGLDDTQPHWEDSLLSSPFPAQILSGNTSKNIHIYNA